MQSVIFSGVVRLFLFFGGFASAAGFDVEVVGPTEPVFLGQVFPCYVVIEGLASQATKGKVDFPSTDGLEVRAVGDAASESGGMVKHSFTFECVARDVGELSIEGIRATLGTESLNPEPVTIKVKAPDETKLMRLSVTLSSAECYEGEAVLLSFEWHSEVFLNGVRAVDVRMPVMNDPRFKVHEPLQRVDPNDASAIGIPIENRRVIARLSEQGKGEVPISDVRFNQIVVPRTAGTIEIPGAVLLCSYVPPKDQKFSGFRYPSYFNNDFFDRSVKGDHQRFLVRSEPIRIEVKALPRTGRPADFSGIVGRVSLSAKAVPTVASVSDPIGLELRLSGHPFPQTIPVPSLEDQSALTYSYDFADEAAELSVKVGEAFVRRTIRPLRANTKAIPELRLSFFDPTTGTYGEAVSVPIAVTISSAAKVDAFDAVFGDGSRLRNDLERSTAGISENAQGKRLLRREMPVSWPGDAAWCWLVLLLGPPLLLALVGAASRGWRFAQRDPEAARAKRAHAVFLKKVKELRHSGDVEAEELTDRLVKAVKAYVADRFGLSPGASSDREMVQMLAKRRVEGELVRKLEVFWDHTAARQFSERGGNGGRPVDAEREIPEAIARIEKALGGS